MKESKGCIISFMGVKPSPGLYYTTNRHDCLGRSHVSIRINEDGSFETQCPCCMDHPVVLNEMGSFAVVNGTVIK